MKRNISVAYFRIFILHVTAIKLCYYQNKDNYLVQVVAHMIHRHIYERI